MAIIGLDATYLSIFGKGVSRYQYNLIKSLAKLDKKNCYYVFLNKKNILPELPQQDNFHYVRIYIPKRIIWDQFQLPAIVKKYKLDIYHSVLETLPLFAKTKFVLFIFEIPDYRMALMYQCGYNSLYTRISYRYNKLLFIYSLRKARVIITSSNSTKIDLIQRYNVDEAKIRVLYPAADEQFCANNDKENLLNTRKKYSAEAGYILHISSSDPRDNTPTVIRAFHEAQCESQVSEKLIIYGDINSRQLGLDKLINELNLKNKVIFIRRFIDKEVQRLAQLYQAADLYVDPSLYEGFGFQVVEAMSCGTPVITSNVTSLPEVVGNAGILVSPTDINGLASAIVRILTDSELRQALCQKSLERARFFSWEKTAQETLAIYDELLPSDNHY